MLQDLKKLFLKFLLENKMLILVTSAHGALISGVQHSGSISLYIILCSPQEYLPSVTIQHYYNIIDQ